MVEREGGLYRDESTPDDTQSRHNLRQVRSLARDAQTCSRLVAWRTGLASFILRLAWRRAETSTAWSG